MLKSFLSELYYSHIYSTPLDHFVRYRLNGEIFAADRPALRQAVCTDLFFWRQGEEWDTAFKLFNISSFLYPEIAPKETCCISFFDSHGVEQGELNIDLMPFELKTINFQDIPFLKSNEGTFAVFHFSDITSKISKKNSHLTERGYIAYKRKKDILYSFCHGNLQSFSKTPNSKVNSIVGTSPKETSYTPQLTFSDCSRFELIYTNPSNKKQKLKVDMLRNDGTVTNNIETQVDPKGVKIIEVDNSNKNINTIKGHGKIIMWRPAIIKFYESHFDVLHG